MFLWFHCPQNYDNVEFAGNGGGKATKMILFYFIPVVGAGGVLYIGPTFFCVHCTALVGRMYRYMSRSKMDICVTSDESTDEKK
jgi:hypothetical protein